MNESLERLLEPVLVGLGCRLWGMEQLTQGKQSTLKVYIDSDDGVGVEDCVRVSRQISSLLDVHDPFDGRYTLEVSSPGLDRRLFTKSQFEEFVGATIRVRLRTPYEGQRRFSGVLSGIEGDDVVLRIDADEEFLFSLGDLDRANVIPEK